MQKKSRQIFVGNHPIVNLQDLQQIQGSYLEIENEIYYRIANYDQMPPFFMSLVSDSDHWFFISSTGACTAGRKNPDNALFPYYTDDRIHDSQEITGSKTIFLVTPSNADNNFLWEPFSKNYPGIYSITRNLYKNIYGNKIIFEEINRDLGLTFRYAWYNSEKFGFIKHSTLLNNNLASSRRSVAVSLIDGIQNILPAGIDRRFQLEYSTLADGYKKSELLVDSGIGIYMLSSIPIDRPEPSESLRATTVWSIPHPGGGPIKRLLSDLQLNNFRKGLPITEESDLRATRGAYFINADINIAPTCNCQWYLIAEVNQDLSAIVSLKRQILSTAETVVNTVMADVARGTENLISIVARADGLELTEDQLSTSRHFSNTLFNLMRGGIFDHHNLVMSKDFVLFVKNANKTLAQEYHSVLQALPEVLSSNDLQTKITALKHPLMEKLFYEYLPITFSRRHGDPSRPWNFFSVEIKNQDGGKILNYQGNWRDLFQNWEALAVTYPHYIEGMISKFVNASTADGYNPYRVTRDGFDWEVLDPHDTWSFIGYWGDHQIIYLLKLLEISQRYHPGKLQTLLNKAIFTYANVPYRIKTYQEILKDPHQTITFDQELNQKISDLVSHVGNDGKFLRKSDQEIVLVTLGEKLLLSVLTKVSNFIPEAGIWLNTQRPEWNDANNALVGHGVSMVTLYYLRRYVTFCNELFTPSSPDYLEISKELVTFFKQIFTVLQEQQSIINTLTITITDKVRKKFLDLVGTAGSNYRSQLYERGLSGDKEAIPSAQLHQFFKLLLVYIDHSIAANRRSDELYHAYNLIEVKKESKTEKEEITEIAVEHLYPMLEGQVAILSSGYLNIEQCITVLDALRKSELFREDQYSYILYPNRQLPHFMKKNTIPIDELQKSTLLQRLLSHQDRSIIVRDVDGNVHFHWSFRNKKYLEQALNSLPGAAISDQEKEAVLSLYERVFNHHSFTGRSGSFYKYEGLGSIYWHMVSKLLLAIQENVIRAERTQEEGLQRLVEIYYDVRNGIGVDKSPDIYGAFPTDPYSHTPGHLGAQQPGMTGQVKEDLLSRYGELGVRVSNGELYFDLSLLRKSEFLSAPHTFHYFDLEQKQHKVDLPEQTLAYTISQVLVVYHLNTTTTPTTPTYSLKITKSNGQQITLPGRSLGQELSAEIFNRSGVIERIDLIISSNR
ncbi:MAG: hypothetical protein HQK53_03805 [Oligoflexia bacterium]|nr:hypothetical protein [Oligoflexia bacterium]